MQIDLIYIKSILNNSKKIVKYIIFNKFMFKYTLDLKILLLRMVQKNNYKTIKNNNLYFWARFDSNKKSKKSEIFHRSFPRGNWIQDVKFSPQGFLSSTSKKVTSFIRLKPNLNLPHNTSNKKEKKKLIALLCNNIYKPITSIISSH